MNALRPRQHQSDSNHSTALESLHEAEIDAIDTTKRPPGPSQVARQCSPISDFGSSSHDTAFCKHHTGIVHLTSMRALPVQPSTDKSELLVERFPAHRGQHRIRPSFWPHLTGMRAAIDCRNRLSSLRNPPYCRSIEPRAELGNSFPQEALGGRHCISTRKSCIQRSQTRNRDA